MIKKCAGVPLVSNANMLSQFDWCQRDEHLARQLSIIISHSSFRAEIISTGCNLNRGE